MDFTPLVPCGKTASVACDAYIATTYLPSKVIVRSTASLAIKRIISIEQSFDLAIAVLQWTISDLDGHHRVLIADSKAVLAYDIEDEEWSLDISEGLGGVRHAEWSETGNEILIWAEFQLKMTVWSVTAASGTILPNPKLLSKGFHARPGRKQAALLQRTSHDILAIIDTTTAEWQIQKSFTLATSDAQGVRWSPDGDWLVVWDNVIEYKVLIYTPDGRLVRTFAAYDVGLGVKSIAWSPTTEYLAIGSYDDKVRLLNTSSFSCCMQLSHVTTLKDQRACVWRQVQSGMTSRYEPSDSAISPPLVKAVAGDVLSRQGVSVVSFSPNGYFLATKSDKMPTTLWIWSLREFSLVAILINNHPIKQIQWMPNEVGEIVFTCQGSSIAENNALYSWNIDWSAPRIISVPRDGFEVRWISIVPQSAADVDDCGLLIGCGDAFTIGYTVPEVGTESDYAHMSTLQEENSTAMMDDTISTLPDSLQRQFDPQGSVIIHDLPPTMDRHTLVC